jgi:hypothetical protein
MPVLQISSIARIESKIHPGVFYVIRNRTEAQRIELRSQLAEVAPQRMDLEREIIAIGSMPWPEVESLSVEQEQDRAEWQKQVQPVLNRFNELMVDVIQPQWVRWGLHSIDGLEVLDSEGIPQKIDGENAIYLLPKELFAEAIEAIYDVCELGPQRTKNLQSPITSNAAEDGRTNGIGALTASHEISTESATAGSFQMA